MLKFSIIFFVISLIAGLAGLSGVAGVTMDIAKFFFFGFLILAAIFLAIGIGGAKKIKDIVN